MSENVHASMQTNYSGQMHDLENALKGTKGKARPIDVRVGQYKLGEPVSPQMQTRQQPPAETIVPGMKPPGFNGEAPVAQPHFSAPPEHAAENLAAEPMRRDDQAFLKDPVAAQERSASFAENVADQVRRQIEAEERAVLEAALQERVDARVREAYQAAAPPGAPNVLLGEPQNEMDYDEQLSARAMEAARRVASRTLTNEEILRVCQPFFDPSVGRPIFISRPINRQVFIGMYPTYGEILTAEKMLGSPPRGSDEGVIVEYNLLSELAATIKGWVFENHPALPMISLHPGDPGKWPTLFPAQFLSAMHPSMRMGIFPQLAADYVEWKNNVTPTTAEMEKFYALIG